MEIIVDEKEWKGYSLLNRAMQAAVGLKIHSITGVISDMEMVNEFWKSSVDWFEECCIQIKQKTDDLKGKDLENYVKTCLEEIKADFSNTYDNYKFAQDFYKADIKTLWELYFTYYDCRTFQLWINKQMIEDVINTDKLGKTNKYLSELPNFTRVIIYPNYPNSGIRAEFDIPIRELVKDYIMLLSNVFNLEQKIKVDNSKRYFIEYIDGYARQLLVMAVTIIEASLNDYNWIVLQICQDKVLKQQLEDYGKKGVSFKIDKLPKLWMNVLNNQVPIPKCVKDLLTITEVRNRLVHQDNREFNWHSSKLNLFYIYKSNKLSERVVPYLTPADYGYETSYIGYEIPFVIFALDTVIENLQFYHQIVYGNNELDWLNFKKNEKGLIDTRYESQFFE